MVHGELSFYDVLLGFFDSRDSKLLGNCARWKLSWTRYMNIA